MSTQWTPGLRALHQYWSGTHNAPHNRSEDKKRWQAIERYYEAAEKAGDQKAMDYWVDVARRFAELCHQGSTSWEGPKPACLED